jgi:CHAT domain-containing protein
MRALLEWIWDKAVQPVLQHLGYLETQTSSSEKKPRIWWVTSGALGLLPLHAAGKGTKSPSENAYTHVVSTYIPTFASLAFARQCQAKVDTVSPNMALVTMPETPGGLEPLSTEHEAQAIRNVFAKTNHFNKELLELCLPSATDVLTHVRGSNIDVLHLACHADPNLDDPSNTALLFGSEPSATEPDPLPVRQLRRLPTAQHKDRRPPRLAYLSACCTAQQYDLRLIDENIHLAAAFQLCGFPAVIGTLWEADDTAAVVIAAAFYEELFRLDAEDHQGQPGDHAARALDFAAGVYRSMKVGRGSAANDALAWASFVHIGA